MMIAIIYLDLRFVITPNLLCFHKITWRQITDVIWKRWRDEPSRVLSNLKEKLDDIRLKTDQCDRRKPTLPP